MRAKTLQDLIVSTHSDEAHVADTRPSLIVQSAFTYQTDGKAQTYVMNRVPDHALLC